MIATTTDVRSRIVDELAGALHDRRTCGACRSSDPLCVEHERTEAWARGVVDALAERPTLVGELALAVLTGRWPRVVDVPAPRAPLDERPVSAGRCGGCGTPSAACLAAAAPCCPACPRNDDADPAPVVPDDGGECACGGAIRDVPGAPAPASHSATRCRSVPLYRAPEPR